MSLFLPALVVAFASLCVWLGVRIVNRRERWAKRTAVAIGLPVLYVLSFGPACWITSRTEIGPSLIPLIYRPLVWTFAGPETGGMRSSVGRIVTFYSNLGAAENWYWSGPPPYANYGPPRPATTEGWNWGGYR